MLGANLLSFLRVNVKDQNFSVFKRFIHNNGDDESPLISFTMISTTIKGNVMSQDIFFSLQKTSSVSIDNLEFSGNSLPVQVEPRTKLILNFKAVSPPTDGESTTFKLSNSKVNENILNNCLVLVLESFTEIEIINSEITHNNYNKMIDISQSDSVSISDTTFDSNNMQNENFEYDLPWSGEALLISSCNSVHIDNLNILNSMGYQDPPGLSLFDNSDVRLTNVNIKNNTANFTSTTEHVGCALFISQTEQGVYNIEGSHFEDNILVVPTDNTEGGAGIHALIQVGTLNLKESSVSRNKANDGASGIYTEALVSNRILLLKYSKDDYS